MPISSILSLIGAGSGILSNIYNNEKIEEMNWANQQHENEMLGLQSNLNEIAAQNADTRTRALYYDLQSPEAMRKQLEDAGMSIGLMYGKGGMGGQMSSGAQASAPTPQNYGRFTTNPIVDAQAGQIIANAAKTAAETENIKEDTKKKQADTANAWKDLDVKSKQMIVMDNQIDEIKQGITESQQRIDNMIEENANIIEQRGEIKASKELKEAQADYNKSLKALTDIQIEWEPKKQAANLENIKALTSQYKAAAKKMMAEAKLTEEQTNILKKQSEDLVKKLSMEVLMMEYEKDYIQPQEFEKLKSTIRNMDAETMTKIRKGQYWTGEGPAKERFWGMLQVFIEDLLPF